MFNQIVSDLKRIDVKFANKNKTLMLLNSLPVSPAYKNLVTTLMCEKETIQLEEIRSNPLSFNIRKKANDENSQGEGLVVRCNQKRERNKSRSKSRNNKAQSKSRKRKDIQSYKCGKTRHIK